MLLSSAMSLYSTAAQGLNGNSWKASCNQMPFSVVGTQCGSEMATIGDGMKLGKCSIGCTRVLKIFAKSCQYAQNPAIRQHSVGLMSTCLKPAAKTTTPTAVPTHAPSQTPTVTPTEEPTAVPTTTPTEVPTTLPPTTNKPSLAPTRTPTEQPTSVPTATPTEEPTAEPTMAPTVPPTATAAPTATAVPSKLVSGDCEPADVMLVMDSSESILESDWKVRRAAVQ